MSQISGHNYIGGAYSAAGDTVLQSFDAVTGAALDGQFIQATREEVDAAALAASAAYPAYRGMAAARRAGFLEAIAAELDALDRTFIDIVCRETALPAARIEGERSRTSNQLRLFAQVLRRGDFYGARIDRALPQRQPLPRADLRQCRIGVGPVAVFGASNFPWRFPLPVATPQRHWRPAARWCSKRTAGTCSPAPGWRPRLVGRWRKPQCLTACSI